MRSSKRFVNFLNKFHMFMSTKPNKIQTYYDVLNVSPYSNHNDIKSAYYNLSKKYHPDKNKSSEAKIIFQNLSDAYEILGNFDKRRDYDRRLRITNSFTRPIIYPVDTNDIKESKGKKVLNQKLMYDFDEWTRYHYQDILEKELKKKKNKHIEEQENEEFEKMQKRIRHDTKRICCIMVIFFCTVLMHEWWMQKNYIKMYKERTNNK